MADPAGPTARIGFAAHADIYRRLVGARIRADWQYRTSFVLYTLSQFLVTFVDFIGIVILFHHVPSLSGWSLAEVAFLYGASGIAFQLGDTFISEVELAARHIKLGTFDQFLIRPLGPLFQLSCTEFAFRRAGKLVQAALVFAIAVPQLDVDWTVGRVLMVPVMLAAGTVIFSAVWVITSSIAFWTVETQEVANAFTYGGNYLTQFPIEIYARWLRRLFTFVVPVAFVNYFPALYVLGRDDPFGTPGWLRFASPAVAVLLAFVARAVWNLAVRHYRSTGS